MKRLMPLIICLSVFLSSCAPRLTPCGIDYPLHVAYCKPSWGGNGYTMPLDQLEKYSCFSPSDFADLLRGVTKNIRICTIIDDSRNEAYCHDPKKGGYDTTVDKLHKYICLSDLDLATYERWYLENHS